MEAHIPEPKSPSEPQLESSFAPYWHLVGFAFGYALLTFCWTGVSEFEGMVVPVFVGISSTVVLIGLWSVFGPGSYLKRLFWSHLIGMIPAAGFLLGMTILSIGEASLDLFVYGTLVGLLSIFPISLGAQIPFWFFRGLFGWQFVFGNAKPAPAFSLRDIFAVTFVFAMCFAIPQIAVNLQARMFDLPMMGADVRTTSSFPVTQPDGTVVIEEREVRDEDAERMRRSEAQMVRVVAFAGFAYVSVLAFLASLFGLPILFFVFRMKSGFAGCGMTAVYALGLFLLVALFGMIVSGGGAEIEFLFYFGGTLASCFAGVAVPMLISHKTGFRLTSPKRFEREQMESGLVYSTGKTSTRDNLPPTDPVDPLA